MGFFNEFKQFAMRGNVVDLAVGVIIGAEFGKIVSSLVNDVLMPPIGMLLGGVDFRDLFFALDGKDYESLAKAKELGAPLLAYGNFIQAIVNFLIIAFAVFMLVKLMNSIKRKEDEKPTAQVEPPKQEVLLEEIRDLLKNK
ncbi:MAG: large-conductance mechanosensitive channel protein MscL [Cytophagales bacterium]